MTVVLKILLSPFIWGFRGVRNIVENGIDEIKYGDRGIGIILRLLPLISVIYTLGIGVFAFVKFVVTGGYGRVIDAVKTEGLLSLSEKMYTNGTAQVLYNSKLFIILMSMLLVATVYMAVQFVKEESNTKNIIFIIITVITVISETLMTLLCTEIIDIDEKYYIPVIITTTVSAIVMFIVASTSIESRVIVREIYRSLYIFLIFVPLVLLTLENVIGLGALVIVMIIMLVVGSFIGGGILPGLCETESSGSPAGSGGSHTPAMQKKARETKKTIDRINYLERNIEENRRGLEEYRNGSWSRGIVDEKLTNRTIENNLKEIERLKRTL